MAELLTEQGVKDWIAAGGVGPVTIQGVDLTGFSADLVKLKLGDSMFLGCTIDPKLRDHLQGEGAHILPETSALPSPIRCFPTEPYDIAWL